VSAPLSRTPVADSDAEFVAAICARVTRSLEGLLERGFALWPRRVERRDRRVAGRRAVHLAFRLRFVDAATGSVREGCLLLPWEEAAALAARSLMLGERTVAAFRKLRRPDETTKEALRDLNVLLAGAVDRALASFTFGRLSCVAFGPQGVRPGVRPAFEHVEGEELIVARVEACCEGSEPFEVVWMLPVVG